MNKNDHHFPAEKFFAMLSLEQKENILSRAFAEGNFSFVMECVGKGGFPVTTYILYQLLFYQKQESILQLLSLPDLNYDTNIYDFLVEFIGQDDADDFFIKNEYHALMKEKISSQALVRNQAWEALKERKDFASLAHNGKFEYLGDDPVSLGLLKEYKCLEMLIEKEAYKLLPQTKESLNLLAERKLWEPIAQHFIPHPSLPRNDLGAEEILWQNNQQELLYKYKAHEFLIKEKGGIWIERYRKDKNFYWLLKYTDKVTEKDWIDWWNSDSKVRSNVIFCAKFFNQWKILRKLGQHKVLWKEKKYQEWVLSFFDNF